MRYAVVDLYTWRGETFSNLNPTEKLLAIYLLTCPDKNILGCFYLPICIIVLHTGLDEASILNAFDKLDAEDFAAWEKDVCWIKNHLLHNPIRNSKQAQGAIAVLDDTPRSEVMRGLLEVLKKDPQSYIVPIIEAVERKLEGKQYHRPLPAIDTDTGEPEEFPVPEPKHTTCKKEDYPPEFEEFWEAYPGKKLNKKGAYSKWKARLKDKYKAEDMIAAARNYAESCRIKGTEEQYIKMPQTFLGPNTPFEDYINGLPQADRLQQFSKGAQKTLKRLAELERQKEKDAEKGDEPF